MTTRLQFDELMISQEERYSLGIERTTGKHYLSVEMTQDYVEFEEFYEISEEEFASMLDDPEAGQAFARRCRAGGEDSRLFRRPETGGE
ncbi:hypothetical protein [Hansschlegelia zhihuaiae]|uniref:Uncharacterized protein n=1 Tax=Hansschlegelia zhihuaiae TaxID=405005 RepID=A0A4V1KHG3_9HYPH|nr:hypothetical protein [Hansschlegelia zhihuaiae]RXF67092.1 hypothetical protein EK403_21755 [Hansschlegelia zhihuaiae]